MDEKQTLQEIVRVATARLIEIGKGTQETLAPDPVADSIAKLEWKKNSYGEWSFAKTKQGGLTPDAIPLLDAIHAAGGKLNLGGYLYTTSEDGRFLSRKRNK